jgi:hypothetical protein
MPAPLDLTGRRFGALVVQVANGRVKWGKWQTLWRCRCDCGADVDVPQNRLPHRDSIPPSHRVEACDDCRSRPCAVCGGPVPASSASATCSAACHDERKRQYHLAYYHRRAATDPEFAARMAERASRRYRDLTPDQRRAQNARRAARELDALGRDGKNAVSRAQYARRMQDPEKRAAQRARTQAWAAANPERVKELQRDAARRKRARRAAVEMAAIIERTGDGLDEG